MGFGILEIVIWKRAQKELSRDKYIGPLIKKYGDCTIAPRHYSDYFEHLCSSIVNQQLSGKAADAIFGRFAKTVGKITPENVLRTDDQILRNAGLSWGKVKYIKDLAKRTHEGSLETKNLENLSDEEVIKELTAVKGIGVWTAHMFLMFTLARPDIFPSGDLGVRKGVEKITNMQMTNSQLEQFALRWKPYRTVASWYIWQNLDNR